MARLKPSLIGGRHAVLEAIRSGHPPEKVFISTEASRTADIIDEARRGKIPCTTVSPQKMARMMSGPTQGVIALVPARRFARFEQVVGTKVVLLLDGITDPRNLGAILRSAEASGVGAVVLPGRRAAPLTPVAVKASAGAVAHLTLCKVSSIAGAILRLQEKRYQVLGLDPSGTPIFDVDLARSDRIALVVGREGDGLHRLVRERCDQLVGIPMAGKVESLNVSVAAGIVLFECLRRRQKP